MKAGFGRADITPEVGTELCGFGAYLKRRSERVRDRIWAKAMALELDGRRALVVGCDLIGIQIASTRKVRELVSQASGLPPDALMICCSHNHGGPNPAVGGHSGWGEADPFYCESLPYKIARACLDALNGLEKAEFSLASVPCEGVGLNREYDKDNPPLEEVLRDDWRPAKPELTDTTCQVLSVRDMKGRLKGFVANFGCHPVVCCASNHSIHGDYCGVAMSMIEREIPGSTGVFIQGALGDVNSCVVHKPEQEALLALDVVAARFANSVRAGLASGSPIGVGCLRYERRDVQFSLRLSPLEELKSTLAGKEAIFKRAFLDGETVKENPKMELVIITALRRIIAAREAGDAVNSPAEIQGIRLGDLEILASGFEVFQAIKNDVVAKAAGPKTFFAGISNDTKGYAVDRRKASEGGYAARTVPWIMGSEPYQDIHGELSEALLELSRSLASA